MLTVRITTHHTEYRTFTSAASAAAHVARILAHTPSATVEAI